MALICLSLCMGLLAGWITCFVVRFFKIVIDDHLIMYSRRDSEMYRENSAHEQLRQNLLWASTLLHCVLINLAPSCTFWPIVSTILIHNLFWPHSMQAGQAAFFFGGMIIFSFLLRRRKHPAFIESKIKFKAWYNRDGVLWSYSTLEGLLWAARCLIWI